MRSAIVGLLLGSVIVLSGCARGVAVVQQHHAQEFGCDARFVRVDRQPQQRYLSHGCGFDADWVCAQGACTLEDSRAHGTGGP